MEIAKKGSVLCAPSADMGSSTTSTAKKPQTSRKPFEREREREREREDLKEKVRAEAEEVSLLIIIMAI